MGLIKKCTTCLLDKETTEFNFSALGKYQVRSICKACSSSYYRAQDKGKIQERNKRARERARIKDPEFRRWEAIQRKYGLSEQEWTSLFEKQGKKCACCGSEECGTSWNWNTDHDHVTNRIRGIVCHRCNRVLGSLGDTLENVKKSTEMYLSYLEHHAKD